MVCPLYIHENGVSTSYLLNSKIKKFRVSKRQVDRSLAKTLSSSSNKNKMISFITP